MTERIDDCLSVRHGHLFIEGCDTTDLVKKHGSPIFVVSENQLRRNARRYHKAFSAHWPDGPVELLPANKANWNTAVTRWSSPCSRCRSAVVTRRCPR